MQDDDLEYVGFWARTGAALIDTVILLVLMLPALISIYGWEYLESEKLLHGPADFVISWVLPAIAVVIFCCDKAQGTWFTKVIQDCISICNTRDFNSDTVVSFFVHLRFSTVLFHTFLQLINSI